MKPALGCLIAVALSGFAAPPAGAQSAPPPQRNANTWNGLKHEPAPGRVQAKERNAGVAPDAQQQQTLTNEVEHLDRKLERQVPGR